MNALVDVKDHYLRRYLEPLATFLETEGVTDVFVNSPGEVWVESLGKPLERVSTPGLGERELDRLARQIAAATHQAISRSSPLMAATLPDGSRVQVVLPPATRGSVSISIRRHAVSDLRLADYCRDGAFDSVATGADRSQDRELLGLHDRSDFAAMLALAVRQRRNILVSGGTASGKTTFLNALLKEIPGEERLITIEDTPELRLQHANSVGLIAVRGDQGETMVTADDLLIASMRMRPDRVILGELRGPEAFAFLRAVNTGHPGSMTTIHADSPDRAIEQLALLVLQGGSKLRRSDVIGYVSSIIDIFVQLGRANGHRHISAIKIADHVRADQ